MSDGFTREPWEFGPTVQEELRKQAEKNTYFVNMFGAPPQPAQGLSEEDVRRIAVAVADELESRARSPLSVDAGTFRRWLGRLGL